MSLKFDTTLCLTEILSAYDVRTGCLWYFFPSGKSQERQSRNTEIIDKKMCIVL